MRNKNGFTLTEILLAVLIVGIIAVALASLTTTASRESGSGRSRVMMRNNLSMALRQLRRDIHDSTRLLYAAGQNVNLGTSAIPLLVLGQNMRWEASSSVGFTPVSPAEPVKVIMYCFVPGTTTGLPNGGSVVPAGATDGGIIYRKEDTAPTPWTSYPDCGTPASDSDFKVWLNHIKFIQYDATYQYPVPYFYVVDYENGYDSVVNHVPANLGSRLHVNLIMELPTAPIVNDVTEEIFVLPNGFRQPPQPQP